jgi:hypothetical protein
MNARAFVAGLPSFEGTLRKPIVICGHRITSTPHYIQFKRTMGSNPRVHETEACAEESFIKQNNPFVAEPAEL